VVTPVCQKRNSVAEATMLRLYIRHKKTKQKIWANAHETRESL